MGETDIFRRLVTKIWVEEDLNTKSTLLKLAFIDPDSDSEDNSDIWCLS